MRVLEVFAWLFLTGMAFSLEDPSLVRPDYEKFSQEAASRFNDVAKSRSVVYTRLAEFLVDRFDLEKREGIGIDVGGGPGDLVFELAARTETFYWINVDINTWFAEPFYEDGVKRGLSHRCGFVFADACSLPFRDGYVDLVVSRGSYQFWPDLAEGLREVHRVMRQGGEAWIGRGFPPSAPESEIRDLRQKGVVGGPKYDPVEDGKRFESIIKMLQVRDYEVILPKAEDGTLYGVWLWFRK